MVVPQYIPCAYIPLLGIVLTIYYKISIFKKHTNRLVCFDKGKDEYENKGTVIASGSRNVYREGI